MGGEWERIAQEVVRAARGLAKAQDSGEVVIACDCGANRDNRWPHHDECSVYTDPQTPAETQAQGGGEVQCPVCYGSGDCCLAGHSAHPNNWRKCETCMGSGTASRAPVGVPYKQATYYADGVYGPDDLAAIWNACVNAHKTLAQQPAAEALAQYSDIISDGGMDPRNQQAQGVGAVVLVRKEVVDFLLGDGLLEGAVIDGDGRALRAVHGFDKGPLAQAQGGGGLSDEIIEALDSLDDDADHLRATGDPAMSGRVRRARNVLHAAIFRNTPPSAPIAQGGGECWSCGKPYTLAQRCRADGRCPSCGVEIELDAPPSAPAGVEAYLVERLTGTGYGHARSIVDAAIHNPTDPAFWTGPEAQAQHRVTPLVPALAQQPAAGRDIEADALQYVFGNMDRLDWARIVDEQMTPPWPLPHHAEAMGMFKQPAAVDGAMVERALNARLPNGDSVRQHITSVWDQTVMRAALTVAQQPAAVDGAIAALPAKWLAEMPNRDECFGNRDASGAAGAYDKCIDDLIAALTAQPGGSDNGR